MDHDRQLVFCETLCLSSLTALSHGWLNGDSTSVAASGLALLGMLHPSDEQVAARLSAPVVTTQLDTRNIAFERSERSSCRATLQYLPQLPITTISVDWKLWRPAASALHMLVLLLNNSNMCMAHELVHKYQELGVCGVFTLTAQEDFPQSRNAGT